jgi:hypothetical protein
LTRCASCPGVAHPDTGCAWSERTLVCAECTRRFWAWLKQHTRPRNGTDFYGAATRWKEHNDGPI